MKNLLLGILFIFSLSGCVGEAYIEPGTIYAGSEPPAPMLETMPASPGYGYYWVSGYWSWVGTRYYWIPGHYTNNPRIYVGPQYYRRGGRHIFIAPHYRSQHRR